MPDLVEWLEAAIGERGQVAEAATAGPWVATAHGFIDVVPSAASGTFVASAADTYPDGSSDPILQADAEHIALNDPHAVLRRCAADRKILADWLERTSNPYEGWTDDQMHYQRAHPAYEYATTEGPRKAWDRSNEPPEGYGWERNSTSANPEAWERFDYHEESYWRRLRPDGVREWQRPEPPLYIRLLAEGYGYQEVTVRG